MPLGPRVGAWHRQGGTGQANGAAMLDRIGRSGRAWLLLLVAALPGCASLGPREEPPAWRRVGPGATDGPRLPAPTDIFRA